MSHWLYPPDFQANGSASPVFCTLAGGGKAGGEGGKKVGKGGGSSGSSLSRAAALAARLERRVLNCLGCGKIYDCRSTSDPDVIKFLGAILVAECGWHTGC
jgi:hypothetical protein